MALVNPSTNNGASGSINCPVPTGVQAGDIVILTATNDYVGYDFASRKPTGFTTLYTSAVTTDGQTVWIGWKRLTGADSGSYTFTDAGNPGAWVCQAVALRGRHATNPPVATENIDNTGSGNPVTITATGVTALVADDIVWVSAPDVSATGIGNGHTPPTNYTEQADAENGFSNLSIALRQNVSAGATGSISGTLALTSGTAGWVAYLVRVPSIATIALTGTVTASITEADIVNGGKTIILTITNDTWIAAGAASFDLQRQNIINGLTSAQSETFGWNLVPKALQGVAGVVRTSDTVVTITLDAFATYNITATETITATIPATALTGGVAVVASPTFAITATAGGATTPLGFRSLLGVGI